MVASAHNGGRSQFNMNGVGFGGSFEFMNVLKTSQRWGPVSGSTSIDPGDWVFDANGYPTIIPVGTNGIKRKTYITTQTQRSGNWVVLWDGGGTIYVSGGATVSGSKTSSAATTNNRYEFSMAASPSTDSLDFGIASVLSSSEYPHNIRVVHAADETALLAGGVFGAEFLSKLQESGVGAIRFLGWLGSDSDGANNSAITTWASRKPVGYVGWGNEEYRYSLYAGTTTNSGDDYSITVAGTYAAGSGAPVHNEGMILKWSATATGESPTLNKNGTGAKPIIRPSGALLFVGATTGRPGINTHSYVVYNSVLDVWLNFGASNLSGYLVNGCPPEICVQLCAELGAHPYFAAPFLAADPVSDFMTSLAAYCRDNGPAWMIPRFEGPNETWNGQTPFYATQYAKSVQLLDNGGSLTSNPSFTATAMSWTGTGTTGVSTVTIGANTLLVGSTVVTGDSTGVFGFDFVLANVTEINVGGNPSVVKINRAPTGGTFTGGVSSVVLTPVTTDINNWYGKAVSNLGEAIAGVYGVVKANVKTQSLYHMIAGVQTFTTTSDSSERLAATSYVLRGGDPASDWVTHICCAQYYGPSVYGGATETTLATAYAGGDLTAPQTYVDYVLGAATGFNLAQCLQKYQDWKAWALSYGINRMCGYEGGYSCDYISGQTDRNNLRRASKDVDDLLWHNEDNIRNFLAQTDGSFTAEFPSNFLPFARSPPNDIMWAILTDIYQTPTPPQWTSVRLFNARYSRKRLTATS
jgi:hypothetical protein